MSTKLFLELAKVANDKFDGHLTIMKFTTNWRICFFTPNDREDIDCAAVGKTFELAAKKVLKNPEDYTWPIP